MPGNNAHIPQMLRSCNSSPSRSLISTEACLGKIMNSNQPWLILSEASGLDIWKGKIGTESTVIKSSDDFGATRVNIVFKDKAQQFEVEMCAFNWEGIVVDGCQIGWDEESIESVDSLKWEFNGFTRSLMQVSLNVPNIHVVRGHEGATPMKLFPTLKLLDRSLSFFHYAKAFAGATYLEDIGYFVPEAGNAVEFKIFADKFVGN